MGNKYNSDLGDNIDLLRICASFREDIKKIMETALKKSAAINEEQFLSEVLTGICPRCGSNQTRDCENMEAIEDFSVGLCISCGYLWCSECGKPLGKDTRCNHWDICRICNATRECEMVLSECEKLRRKSGKITETPPVKKD